MNKAMFAIFLFLVSHVVYADKVASISVFQIESNPVIQDLNAVNKHIPVKVYQVDALDLTEKVIDQKVQKRLHRFKAATPIESYTNAFFDLLNSSEWPEIAEGFDVAGEAVEFSVRYKIKKVPAIVFNDRDVIYGVTSLSQAMVIFNASQGVR